MGTPVSTTEWSCTVPVIVVIPTSIERPLALRVTLPVTPVTVAPAGMANPKSVA